MKNGSVNDCREAIRQIEYCLETGKLATSPAEIKALDHINACTENKKCVIVSVDYFEKLIRGQSLCGAFATPNVNYHQ